MTIARNEDGRYLDHAWPGGYPVFHICDDGGYLCPACANDPANPIHEDTPNDGWRIVASDINYEDPELYCDHCNERIPSAYAEE